MRISTIIPTRDGDSPTLREACISLSKQTLLPVQVLISIDHASAPEPDMAVLKAAGIDARIIRGENAGPAAARNRALIHVTGDCVLFLNDDVVPTATCLAAHAAAQEATGPAMILGSAPWCFDHAPQRVIDRLVSETSMIFFYDQMSDAEPERDWGFRHAWTLNLSVPCHACPRFDERFCFPMFEDLEWAFRFTAGGLAVRFVPSASVKHCHRPFYTTDTLARREVLIGHQSHLLRDVSPMCYEAAFGTLLEPSFAAVQLSLDALRLAQESYAEFVAYAERNSEETDIASVYQACRQWREVARAIGWEAAELDRSAEFAVQSAHDFLLAPVYQAR